MSEKYKEGLNRNQQLLFPPSLDEYVDEANPVRAIDDYVSLLDLKRLGFSDTSNSLSGQKSYAPKLLLKIYIYAFHACEDNKYIKEEIFNIISTFNKDSVKSYSYIL